MSKGATFSSYYSHGRFVETYLKATQDTVLAIGSVAERLEAKRAGRLRRMAYVSRSLLVAIAAGDWLHADEWILCRFVADESPAYPVEADRLTPALYRTILKASADFLAGRPDAATRGTVTERIANVRRVAAELGIYADDE